ncbi:MAG: hypothetical protein K2X04_10830 [Burkholderiales bacterium]|jgi:hypothetical protein|nr:hypothetical protein [Burkholderiales bacterium]
MKLYLPIWHRSNGEIVSCAEKVKVMRENIEELQQVIQDAYEDALLMDVDSAQIKSFLITMIENLENPYKDSNV